jgi:hypothetical protein
MTCPLCARDPHPPDSDPRRCAFAGDGTFLSDNWSCVTMLRLRDRCVWVRRDDLSAGSIGVMPIPDGLSRQGYLVLTWYKERGATPGALIMNDDQKPERLTEGLAAELLEATDP